MYLVAKAEIVRAGLNQRIVAEKMGLTTITLNRKLNGHYVMTVSEASRFKKIVGSDKPLEELFEEA